jgi:SAM-dependent methyltransferase
MDASIESFYNTFASRLIEDYVHKNDRVQHQLRFLAAAIPSSTKSVLILGCGSGESALFVATQVATRARVLGIDISHVNLRVAQRVFRHERIMYQKADLTGTSLGGPWDVIILPDVYEHIPRDERGRLHAQLRSAVGARGRILLTVPSPGKQSSLYAIGKGLQPVDEVVTLEDLIRLAGDVKGAVTYFNSISVWEVNDYLHAVIELDAHHVRPIEDTDCSLIKGWQRRTVWRRGCDVVLYRLRGIRFREYWRRRWVRRRLSAGEPQP